MTDQAISPLRRRMIEDMTIRKLAPQTQASYIRAVRNFTIFLGRSPDQASAEELRRYHLQLASSGVSVPSQNATVTAFLRRDAWAERDHAAHAFRSRAPQAACGSGP